MRPVVVNASSARQVPLIVVGGEEIIVEVVDDSRGVPTAVIVRDELTRGQTAEVMRWLTAQRHAEEVPA